MSQTSGTGTDSPAVVSPTTRWMVLLGALMVQIILGTVYGFSALIKPLQAAFDWNNKDIQWAFTFALLTFAIVMVPAGRLQDKVGPRLPALLGAVFIFCGQYLASLITDASQTMLWRFSYGIVFGAGIGLAYVCPIAALAKWFPDIKGLITGVAVAGFGGGAAVFIPTVSRYLDPTIGGHSVQEFFRLNAVNCGVIVAIGASLLRNPPEGYRPPSARTAAAAATAAAAVVDADWRAMLATGRFWLLWAMFAGSATAGLMTIGVVKAAVGAVESISEGQAALAGSILSILNALGRVFWGGVSDRIGRRTAMTTMFAIQAVTMLVLAPGLRLGAGAAFLLVGLIGLNFGGNFALFPSATADAFGTKNLGVNYGLVFTAYGIGGTIGPMIAAYYKDKVGEFGPAFVIAGVLVGFAALASGLLGGTRRPVAQEPASE